MERTNCFQLKAGWHQYAEYGWRLHKVKAFNLLPTLPKEETMRFTRFDKYMEDDAIEILEQMAEEEKHKSLQRIIDFSKEMDVAEKGNVVYMEVWKRGK